MLSTGGANECDLLARLCIQADIVQNHLIIVVAEVYMLEDNITLKLSVISGTLCLVVMLPCPGPGSLVRLSDGAICIDYCICQHNITVIDLWLLIEQTEDSIASGKSHDDTVQLVTDLVNWLLEALI